MQQCIAVPPFLAQDSAIYSQHKSPHSYTRSPFESVAVDVDGFVRVSPFGKLVFGSFGANAGCWFRSFASYSPRCATEAVSSCSATGTMGCAGAATATHRRRRSATRSATTMTGSRFSPAPLPSSPPNQGNDINVRTERRATGCKPQQWATDALNDRIESCIVHGAAISEQHNNVPV